MKQIIIWGQDSRILKFDNLNRFKTRTPFWFQKAEIVIQCSRKCKPCNLQVAGAAAKKLKKINSPAKLTIISIQ